MKQLLLFCIAAPLLYLCGSSFCKTRTDGFTLNKVTSTLPSDPAWEVAAPLPDKKLLEQKFTYFKSGGQSFAFLSEDGKTVLKLFKHYERWPASLFTSNHRGKKTQKLMRDFASYKIAYDTLREESGLVYLHLNKTENLLGPLRIVDKLGIEHTVSLDKTEFLLQSKADLLYEHIENLMKQGDVSAAKESLTALLHLLSERLAKGIYDEDAKLHRNCGFLEGRPIFIDVGRFCHSSKTQSLEEMTARLSAWLHTTYPELETHLKDEIKNS